jgi:hypothetical protein
VFLAKARQDHGLTLPEPAQCSAHAEGRACRQGTAQAQGLGAVALPESQQESQPAQRLPRPDLLLESSKDVIFLLEGAEIHRSIEPKPTLQDSKGVQCQEIAGSTGSSFLQALRGRTAGHCKTLGSGTGESFNQPAHHAIGLLMKSGLEELAVQSVAPERM